MFKQVSWVKSARPPALRTLCSMIMNGYGLTLYRLNMKTLIFSLLLFIGFNTYAQHVFKASLTLKVIDSTGTSISQSELIKDDYQIFTQKGDRLLYQETNIDSLGYIQISRNDIMPDEIGTPWNIVLIHGRDTMFVQYYNVYDSPNSPLEFSISNGNYIYDLIRTKNYGIEMDWELIDFERLENYPTYGELIDLLKEKRAQCISRINKGEYKKRA